MRETLESTQEETMRRWLLNRTLGCVGAATATLFMGGGVAVASTSAGASIPSVSSPRIPAAGARVASSAGPSSGYRLAAADGGVFAFGSSGFYGSLGGRHLNAPIVGIASDRTSPGYWLVASDGGVFAFGGCHFLGSMGRKYLNAPIVGMAASPDGSGYWLVASDGGVFSFGRAAYFGSWGGAIPQIVGLQLTGGSGYREAGTNGQIFGGSSAGLTGIYMTQPIPKLNAPIVGIS